MKLHAVTRFPLPRLAAIGFSLALLLLVASRAAQAQAPTAQTPATQRPAAIKLFPRNTVAFVNVFNSQSLRDGFLASSMGRMLEDPQMKPLVSSLYGNVVEAFAPVGEQVGVSLPEILSIPQGEVAAGIIPIKSKRPAVIVLLEVGEQRAAVDKLLAKADALLAEDGAEKTQETLEGVSVTSYQLAGDEKLMYLIKDGSFCLCNNPDVLKEVLKRWNSGTGESLADNPQYGAIMQRCQGIPGELPQVAGFADPIGLVRAVGAGNPAASVGLAVLPALGLDGLLGVGGSVAMNTEQYDSVMRGYLMLDNPRGGVLEMLALQPGETEPESWIPADVATYSTFQWDLDKTYRKLVQIVDSFQGEGAFKRQTDPMLQQLGLSLEKDIVPAWGGRVSYLTRFERPVTLNSQSQMVGIHLKDSAKFRGTLDKVVGRFGDRLKKHSFGAYTFHEFLLDENVRNVPNMPHPTFGLLGDVLLIADRPSLIEAVIGVDAGAADNLTSSVEYKLIASKISRQTGGKPGMVSFSRPEEAMRYWYELANSPQTREQLGTAGANNPFFKGLNSSLQNNPLPPFAVIQKYLAPGGSMINEDDNGFYYLAFSLRRTGE